jgi:hypothetical protein
MVSFAHYVASAKTPVGTSSLRHLRRNLHDINFMAILVDASLLLFIIILQEPLYVPYVFFISYARDFSLVLSFKFCEGFSLFDGRHVMNSMSSTSIETGSSNHTNPPWRTASNFFTYLFTYFPCLK